ncbi:MAG: GNAT family N-acetyltransferase [Proteobacteria bacterium]|nr:GNAT family N-acetyltransferase [Pseudomonadota bacterium]
MNITHRKATRSDAPFLAWVMQEAARSHLEKGVFDMVYPGPDDQRLEILETLATTDQVHYGHWSRFMVAEVDGKPAAALSAYENTKHGGRHFDNGIVEMFQKLNWTSEQMAEVPGRVASFLSIGYVNCDDHWVLEFVATRPEHRGKGIMHQLLLKILEEGRREGFDKAQIGYLLGNTPAKNTYEKAGFKWIHDYRHSDFENTYGCPGIASMKLDMG